MGLTGQSLSLEAEPFLVRLSALSFRTLFLAFLYSLLSLPSWTSALPRTAYHPDFPLPPWGPFPRSPFECWIKATPAKPSCPPPFLSTRVPGHLGLERSPLYAPFFLSRGVSAPFPNEVPPPPPATGTFILPFPWHPLQPCFVESSLQGASQGYCFPLPFRRFSPGPSSLFGGLPPPSPSRLGLLNATFFLLLSQAIPSFLSSFTVC